MSSDQEPTTSPTPIWMVLLGWIFTLLISAHLTFSAILKLMQPAEVEKLFASMGAKEGDVTKGMEKLAWPADVMHVLAFVEIGCAVLYFFPRTAVLGAILLTGYLGGAIGAHVRVGDEFWIPIVVAMLMWFGVYFRDDRVRAMVPWRRLPSGSPPTGGFVGVLKPIFLTVMAGVIAIVGVAIVLAAFAASRPDDFRVERSITIDAPASEVFTHVNDFNKWEPWNPWLKLDPTAKVTIEGAPSGKGAIYKWSGNDQIGEGSMTITESKPNEFIRIKLDFTRPMPDTAESEFLFKEDGGKTAVTWKMQAEKDFKGKAIVVVLGLDRFIGDKYAEGVKSLKDVVESAQKKR